MILVLVPHGFPTPPQLWERAAILSYASVEDVVAALAQAQGGIVLVSDGLAEDALAAIAAGIVRVAGPVIEVRSRRWDGESSSPVSAACRGVISGFGPDGVAAALALLEND